MPIDLRMYADGIADTNVRDAVHRIAGAVHDRLSLLESISGANPQTMVDARNNPPTPQNPPPQNTAAVRVQFNAGIYTINVTPPWKLAAQSGVQLGGTGSPPAGSVASYHLQSAADINFQTSVTNYPISQTGVFSVPGPAGLFFRVFTSIDGGDNFGPASPSHSVLLV